uniref:G-protein coupled receptors family 1 profile domain-containing protein n=1 Tax=Laticauda laticaudata TaxID=8630 RepID=A0A8C5RLQ5_LATLA
MELSSPNITVVTEFILVSFQLSETMECFLFWVSLLVFLLTLTGNLAIIALVCVDQRLQTPMYFFLCILSLLETLFVLTICPKMLVSLISLNKTISFRECIAQCYFYFSLGTCEWGFLLLLIPVPFLLHLSFCGSNLIDHFFCDYAPIIKLSCSKSVPFLLDFETAVSLAVMLTTLSINGVSYVYIISAVLRMHSTKGQKKTFSTYISQLTVASIFYGSSIFMYSLPTKVSSQGVQKATALLTAVITPLLNPFIYTLRNQKVKEVLKDSHSLLYKT